MWGEFWSTLGSAGLALLLLCTLLNAAAALILARKSLPQALKMRQEAMEAQIFKAVSSMAEMEAKIGSWEATLNGLIEENENSFSRAERKRASAASTVSKLSVAPRLNGEPPPGASRAERMAWIRSLPLPS